MISYYDALLYIPRDKSWYFFYVIHLIKLDLIYTNKKYDFFTTNPSLLQVVQNSIITMMGYFALVLLISTLIIGDVVGETIHEALNRMLHSDECDNPLEQ